MERDMEGIQVKVGCADFTRRRPDERVASRKTSMAIEWDVITFSNMDET
jgi:hypothetical protein